MKTRQVKQKDLNELTQALQQAKSALIVSFKGATVAKDQEFRKQIREAGARYQVVKNTLAKIAIKDTVYEQAADSLKGVSAIAWTENDPVVLSKAVSKFIKENSDVYTFKSGVVDGKLVDLNQLTTIANLPSKEELISKLLFVINAQAQRLVTVINAVPRNLAVVIKQIGDKAPETRSAGAPATAADSEGKADEGTSAEPEAKAEQTPNAEGTAQAEAAPAETAHTEQAQAEEAPAKETPTEN
jgi:large subunit ribosomal protein L10